MDQEGPKDGQSTAAPVPGTKEWHDQVNKLFHIIFPNPSIIDIRDSREKNLNYFTKFRVKDNPYLSSQKNPSEYTKLRLDKFFRFKIEFDEIQMQRRIEERKLRPTPKWQQQMLPLLQPNNFGITVKRRFSSGAKLGTTLPVITRTPRIRPLLESCVPPKRPVMEEKKKNVVEQAPGLSTLQGSVTTFFSGAKFGTYLSCITRTRCLPPLLETCLGPKRPKRDKQNFVEQAPGLSMLRDSVSTKEGDEDADLQRAMMEAV